MRQSRLPNDLVQVKIKIPWPQRPERPRLKDTHRWTVVGRESLSVFTVQSTATSEGEASATERVKNSRRQGRNG